MRKKIRIIGIDPGLRVTGWGIVELQDNEVRFVSAGTIRTDPKKNLAERLFEIHTQLSKVVKQNKPDEAAVEETFVNVNAKSTLKLGHARAIALLTPAQANINVAEYAPNTIKKAVTGMGKAKKEQVSHMVKMILPKANPKSSDEADALAIAICHANHL